MKYSKKTLNDIMPRLWDQFIVNEDECVCIEVQVNNIEDGVEINIKLLKLSRANELGNGSGYTEKVIFTE